MPEIRHQLTIDDRPEAVYRAITDHDGLASWWTRDTEADPEVGSVARFGFNKRSTVFRMRIDELEPNRRVKWGCLGDDPEWEDTELVFELTPNEGGTVLRFGHLGWKSAGGILPMCSYEWARYLTSLRSYVETGEGSPHDG